MNEYKLEAAMAPVASPEKEMSGHAEMMCQILMQLGKLEAKIDMLANDEKEEDSKEGEIDGPELSTNPALYSPQLEFDLPPVF